MGIEDEKPEDTQPEVPEVYDADRALRTMAEQVATIYSQMPAIMEMVKRQEEHERRIIRLEGKVQKLEEDKAAE